MSADFFRSTSATLLGVAAVAAVVLAESGDGSSRLALYWVAAFAAGGMIGLLRQRPER